MDDSPMYDDVLYDSRTYTMNLNDVGLKSLYALDSIVSGEDREILGDEDNKSRFTSDHERIKRSMQQLWNEQDGIYENRYWDGDFRDVFLRPTSTRCLVASRRPIGQENGKGTSPQPKRVLGTVCNSHYRS